MTAADLTKLISAIAAVLGTVLVPLAVRWSRAQEKARSARALTQASVAQMFKDERDKLQARLDESDERHGRQIAAIEARYQREIAQLRTQYQHEIQDAGDKIRALQAELDGLYRRLYHQPPPPGAPAL